MLLDRLTERIGAPKSVWVCLGVVVCWAALNVALELLHGRAPDPFPFAFLQCVGTVAAVIMTLLIFSAERRLTEVERRRARLMLHFTMLTEQKTAKIIELLEDLRHDDPRVRDRVDPHAQALKHATDPAEALRALERSTEEVQRGMS